MRKLFEFFGGRKMFFGLLLFATTFFFMMIDKANMDQFADFMKWIFGFYMAGNATSKIAKNVELKSK